MRRIVIIGSGGAGKSTLARQLGQKLLIPVFHLDRYYWKPGWVEMPREEWMQMQRQLVTENEEWIMDGNYGGTMDIRLAAADTVIFLDFSPWVCVPRVLFRFLQNLGRTRADMGPGCRERLDWEFLVWVATFRRIKAPALRSRMAGLAPDKRIIRLTTPRQLKRFLDEL